jgi:hypothetical protein
MVKGCKWRGLEEIPQNPDVTMNMACIATEVLSKRHVNRVDEVGCGCFSISQFIIHHPLAAPFCATAPEASFALA